DLLPRVLPEHLLPGGGYLLRVYRLPAYGQVDLRGSPWVVGSVEYVSYLYVLQQRQSLLHVPLGFGIYRRGRVLDVQPLPGLLLAHPPDLLELALLVVFVHSLICVRLSHPCSPSLVLTARSSLLGSSGSLDSDSPSTVTV